MNRDGVSLALFEVLHFGQNLLAYIAVTAMGVRLCRVRRLLLGLKRQIKELSILLVLPNKRQELR